MILIGFTSTATFQLWLNCAQTFGTEIAKIPSQNVSVMQTYYSAGTMVALFVTSVLITKFKQGKIPSDLPSNLSCNVSISLHDQDTY